MFGTVFGFWWSLVLSRISLGFFSCFPFASALVRSCLFASACGLFVTGVDYVASSATCIGTVLAGKVFDRVLVFLGDGS